MRHANVSTGSPETVDNIKPTSMPAPKRNKSTRPSFSKIDVVAESGLAFFCFLYFLGIKESITKVPSNEDS